MTNRFRCYLHWPGVGQGNEWRAPQKHSITAFCFSPFLPSVTVKGHPKGEAFDKATQAQLHQFCYVSALGWVGIHAEDQIHCPVQGGGLDLIIGRQGHNLQLPLSTVGGLLRRCGGLWRQHQLLKAGGPPEKGLLETLFTSSKFYPGQWGRHTFPWEPQQHFRVS